jgi:hypothetical protein
MKSIYFRPLNTDKEINFSGQFLFGAYSFKNAINSINFLKHYFSDIERHLKTQASR